MQNKQRYNVSVVLIDDEIRNNIRYLSITLRFILAEYTVHVYMMFLLHTLDRLPL